ncbi:hypothetical protein GCM10027445_53420 [Amycolatopsis endophytica]|uniref:DUF5666 domain-containing protein n=1 Tax=Amycolatopsis endophytica TaxID=860233 RepID=A0A853AVU4_9PSEU|nr:hypothetical protein [Amycolatopsis endophytica]NYI86769.1 hypothetical protein [Amycolatopsis endophytica]
MTEQQPASQAREWGAQQPPSKWSARKTVAAAAIAVGVAGAGGVAIYAAGGSTDASATQGGPGGGIQMPGGPGGSQAALSSALHGEYVVSDGKGGYTTEAMQIGTVTGISSTSLTAHSDDGYTRTYTIDSDTAAGNDADLSSIATGDTVTVVASVSGQTATADTVTEGSDQSGGQQGRQGTMPRREDGTADPGQN